MHIIPFEDQHIEAAVALVNRRYKSLRGLVPMLPARYEDSTAILPQLHNITKDAPGVAAIENGQLCGFLVGMIFPSFRGKRSAYSPEWANAAVKEHSRELYQHMYAHLSAIWAADQCVAHYATIFADDRMALDAWFWEGFGLLGIDAIRDMSQAEREAPDVKISRATLADVDSLLRLERGLQQHSLSAPTFLVTDDKPDRTGWEDQLQDESFGIWLAWQAGQPVAYMRIGPANPEACLIVRDDKTASINAAYTDPSYRRQGIATALLNRCIEWARSQGHKRCAVDFETMNITAARFWLQYYEPVCYSVLRILDDRVPEQT